MQNNFYTKPKFTNPNTISKRKDSVLFLDYLEHFISNSATKRVQGYGTVGLAKNTIRTYNSLHRVVKAFEFAKSEILYINTIDKYTAESFTHFLKIDQHYSDNYCGQLLKLLKVILRDAERSGLEVYSPRKRATMKSRIIRFRDYEDQQIYRKPDCQVIT